VPLDVGCPAVVGTIMKATGATFDEADLGAEATGEAVALLPDGLADPEATGSVMMVGGDPTGLTGGFPGLEQSGDG
jgi:hypothetical protein